MNVEDLITAVERLEIADGEVLVIRPRRLLTSSDKGLLHRNLEQLRKAMGWPAERIIVVEGDIEMTKVTAEQAALL
jgi:hypothetical protein